MNQPTDNDLARDAVADLAVCNAATPGPWFYECIRSPGAPYRECDLIDVVHAPGQGPDPISVIEEVNHEDAAFIALTRAALPAWIRRAVAAEAEVARLRSMIEGLTARVAAQSELLSRKAEGNYKLTT